MHTACLACAGRPSAPLGAPELIHGPSALLMQRGHYTYECKNEPAYVSRPSRTKQLLNPKVGSRADRTAGWPPAPWP